MRIILALVIMLVCVSIEAATQTAASTSRTDVNTAYTACSDGDTLAIPAGNSSTWSTPITVSKAIWIVGAGTNSTILNSTGSGFFIIDEVHSGVRISQIQFFKSARSGSGNDGEIRVASSAAPTTGFRIDHCFFKNGQYTFRPNSDSTVYGVIDHNHFWNCDAPMDLIGGNDDNWATRKHTGTTNTMVFENNLHTVNDLADNITGWSDQEQFIEAESFDFVVRHCVFDMASLTEYNGIAIEWHGNHEIWDNSGTKRRGPQLIEIYSNIFNINFTYRLIHARGGSFLIYSNAVTFSTANQVFVQMEEEEGVSGSAVNGGAAAKTAWAAEDQINNCHIWTNALVGTGITVVTTNYNSDGIFIKKGHDWWDAAPNNTDGFTDWGANRLGSSNMTYTASGTQWHYPLTQLAYPHPLVTAQDGGGGGGGAIDNSNYGRGAKQIRTRGLRR